LERTRHQPLSITKRREALGLPQLAEVCCGHSGKTAFLVETVDGLHRDNGRASELPRYPVRTRDRGLDEIEPLEWLSPHRDRSGEVIDHTLHRPAPVDLPPVAWRCGEGKHDLSLGIQKPHDVDDVSAALGAAGIDPWPRRGAHRDCAPIKTASLWIEQREDEVACQGRPRRPEGGVRRIAKLCCTARQSSKG
jgi:hypothetical protein